MKTQYALITEAVKNKGVDYALEYAKKGYNLVLLANDSEQLVNLSKRLAEKYNIEIIVFDTDYLDLLKVCNFIKKMSEAKINITEIINNVDFHNSKKYENSQKITILTFLIRHFALEMFNRKAGKIKNVFSKNSELKSIYSNSNTFADFSPVAISYL